MRLSNLHILSLVTQLSNRPGKIARVSHKSSPATHTAAQSKLNRRNHAKQHQTKKRNALVSATRIFNGVDGAPRIVAVVPLSPDADPRSAVCALAESLDVSSEDCPESGLWKLRYVTCAPD